MIKKTEKLFIIIVNWNGTGETIDCLESIKNCSYNNYTTVLVDNGSDTDSLLELKNWCYNNFSQIAFYDKMKAKQGGDNKKETIIENTKSSERLVFIENNENLGFAAGNNVALEYMLNTKASYAMLLNNDTILEKDSITILMDFLNTNTDYVAATPQIRYFKPNNIIWNCGGKITWFGNRRYYFAGQNILKVPQTGFKKISFITGCALTFKPRITGLLTEKFFFGEEDLDFSFRQKLKKRKMACCFSSLIYHKVNASINKVKDQVLGDVYLFYLSRLINNRQYSSSLMFVVKVILNLGYGIPMTMIRYKCSFRRTLIMNLTILKELRRIDNIDKEYFFKFIKEDFRHSITWNK